MLCPVPTQILCFCKISPAGIVVEPAVSALGLNFGDGPPWSAPVIAGWARTVPPTREVAAPPSRHLSRVRHPSPIIDNTMLGREKWHASNVIDQ